LKFMLSVSDSSGKLARWALRLQEFGLLIQHRPGKASVVADALSRLPRKKKTGCQRIGGFT
jgi:hypothetical protein